MDVLDPSLFTTQDGDVILRAGSESPQEHDFRVHRVVLSLASRVFKDLFTTAQPDAGQEDTLPVVTITDSPESIDLLLRFIYPGSIPPIITDLARLSTLLTIADKYDVPSILPIAKGRLGDKEVLENDPFGVYVAARRWGFADEAKKAARKMTLAKIGTSPFSGDPQNLAKGDFFRLLWFMEKRGDEAKKAIRSFWVDTWTDDHDNGFFTCGKHNTDQTREFFERLGEAIIAKFDVDPALDRLGLVEALAYVSNPPPTGFCDEDEENPEGMLIRICCPLRPANVVSNLERLARRLENIRIKYLGEAMDGEVPI